MLSDAGSECCGLALKASLDGATEARLEPSFATAVGAACRFLSFRPRSEAEVRRRLTLRFPPELVDRVVEVLRNKKYLDDDEFAGRWRLNRERFHPRSRRVMERELSKLGVARDVIDRALAGSMDKKNAYQAGLKIAVRQMSMNLTREDLGRKLYPYLLRRGFAYSVAREAVKSLWEDLALQPLDS